MGGVIKATGEPWLVPQFQAFWPGGYKHAGGWYALIPEVKDLALGGGAGVGANALQLVGFFAPNRVCTIDTLAVNVTASATAGATLVMGIYEAGRSPELDGCVPMGMHLMGQTSSVAIDTTGVKSAALSIANLKPNRLYYAAFHCSAAVSLRQTQGTSSSLWAAGMDTSSNTAAYPLWGATSPTYTGTLPTEPVDTSVNLKTPIPIGISFANPTLIFGRFT